MFMSSKNQAKFYKKKAFSLFVSSLKQNSSTIWKCCNENFYNKSSIHVHVSKKHEFEIKNKAVVLKEKDNSRSLEVLRENDLKKEYQKKYINKFITEYKCSCKFKIYTVILFYHYVKIMDDELQEVESWQVISHFSF